MGVLLKKNDGMMDRMKNKISQAKYIEMIKKLRRSIHCNEKVIKNDFCKFNNVRPIYKELLLAKAEFEMQEKFANKKYLDNLSCVTTLISNSMVNKEIWNIKLENHPIQNQLDRNRHKFLIGSLSNFEQEYKEFYQNHIKQIKRAKEKFLISSEEIKNIEELAKCYYIENNIYFYMMLDLLREQLGLIWAAKRKWINTAYNVGFFLETIKNNDFPIILIENDDSIDFKVLTKILSALDKQVLFLKKPILYPIDNSIALLDTLNITLDNIEQLGNVTVFQAIALIKNNEFIGDNRDYIIQHIIDNLIENKLALVLCSGDLMDELGMRQPLQKSFQRLSPFESDYLNRNIAFGWAGDYLAYCDFLYGFDTKSMLNAADECDISIVIPARNSSYSLRHTLRTCLNQRFKGRYEIVLSDNSSDGNTEIYALWKELNDNRIKYFRTPRELPLTKSFEFALLQARGKYVLPIGSDDGVLPWALDVIEKVFNEHDEFDVFAWERGFYAWPGFNKGQQNQFVIPGMYKKDQINFKIYNCEKSLYSILNNPELMYLIPLLYLNSACKRSYFKRILEKTGRLWDGICQDIYMGVVNLAINEKMLLIKYPLTIAGMSNSSIGFTSAIEQQNNQEVSNDIQERRRVDNVGGYCPSHLERILPMVNFDEASLYRSVVRVIERGCLPLETLDKMNWQRIFLNIARKLSKKDIRLEQKLDSFRYAAKQISAEMETFVEKNICEPLLIPEIFHEEDANNLKRTYEIGFVQQDGGLVLDASDFAVENVYDVTILFEKLTGL